MSTKTFTIAGTSNLNGKVKLRVANGSIKHRTAVLTRDGHTDIQLQELPRPMTRVEAKEYLGIDQPEVVAETTVSVESTDETASAE